MKESTRELLKKVRYIEIKADHLVENIVSGQYASVFKGSGIEFEEVRQYEPGDDVRAIDWNVSARTGRPYIKKFVEERELTVMLLVDASFSSRFGTVGQTKAQIIAELVAVIALSAIKNNDKVGLILFTDKVETFLPPKRGRRHVLRVIRDVLHQETKGRKTDISHALEYLDRVMTRRTVTFLISDFFAPDFSKALKLAARKHDIIPILLEDPWDIEIPQIGLVQLEDLENGEQMLIDTSDRRVREELRKLYEKDTRKRTETFQSAGLDWIEIRTDESYILPLKRFFYKRKKIAR